MKKSLTLLFVLFSLYLLLNGCSSNSSVDKVQEVLEGHVIFYYNIAGMRLNYTVQAEDIKEVVNEQFSGKEVWRAKVGEGLSWYVYIDKETYQILKEEPLFVS